MEKYISSKKIAMNIFEKKSIIFNNEKYKLWKIKKNWQEIVGDMINADTEPIYLKNKKLNVYVENPSIYYAISTLQEELINKINDYLKENIVNSLEIKKVNQIKKYKEKKEIKDLEKKIEEKKEKEEFINIKINKEEIENIEKSINKIDKKYDEIAEKLKEIAINKLKKDKLLLQKGYKKCSKCNAIFYPKTDENICFICYGEKQNEKENKMRNILIENPYISEKRAVELSDSDEYTYYKMRDVLAERVYKELIYFTESKNLEIEINSDFYEEIRKEAKLDFEILIRNYIDYKIGTENEEIYINERKKVLKKIKNEMAFRRKFVSAKY